MRTIVINQEQSNRRIDKVLKEIFSSMPVSAMYKAFRKKDVKVNGIRVKEDHIVMTGDRVEVYIIDDILFAAPKEDAFKLNQGFTTVFEDSNLLIVNKEQGIPVHPDREQATGTLIDMVRQYLTETGEFDPKDPCSFPPSLCHRLDRNTGGLTIIAKNSDSLKFLTEKIQDKEIRKFYQCIVKGKMDRNSDELISYLVKDENKSRVFISDRKTKDSLIIITRYRVISYDSQNDISKLDVELVTGRTHQIRAHLAHIGHPIIGDGKYGTNAINKPFGAKYQALWAYKLIFDFSTPGVLSYLNGRSFEIEPIFKIKNIKNEG